LLVVLLIANWVGIRERYVVSSFPCSDFEGQAVGDVDVRCPGDELILWTTSAIFAVYNVTSRPGGEVVYTHLGALTNPLTGLVIANFNPERKGDEIMAVTANGTVLLFWRDPVAWNVTTVTALPWPSPVWTTRAVVGAQLDVSSPAAEMAIVGEHFDWPTLNRTGRILVVNRASNVTWQVSVAYTAAQPLLCAAAGDVDQLHPGLELLTAGDGAAVAILAVTNGSWSAASFYSWSGVVSSIAIGNLIAAIRGYEVGLVLNGQCFYLSYDDIRWTPRQIWQSNTTQTRLETLTACDVDPFNPGDELVGLGVSTITGESVLVILAHNGLLWTSRVLLVLPKGYVTAIEAASLDFNRVGSEILVGSENLISVYAIPDTADRTSRATNAVLLPAVILLPGTIVLFVLADYVGRVAAERRRTHALLMATKGFAQCPVCRRFVPRADLEAHRRAHRRHQLLLMR
jgi:hypothetical protein